MTSPKHTPTETEQCHRYEITGAMDQVVRYCGYVVTDHSHRGFWTPTGPHPTSSELIDQARDILTTLRMAIRSAETIAREIEHDQQHQHPRAQPKQPGE